MDAELQKKWKAVEGFLRRARSDLPPDSRIAQLLTEFDGYLSHNELELALDSLAEAGGVVSPPGIFWNRLVQAAELLELHEKKTDLLHAFVEAAAAGLRRRS